MGYVIVPWSGLSPQLQIACSFQKKPARNFKVCVNKPSDPLEHSHKKRRKHRSAKRLWKPMSRISTNQQLFKAAAWYAGKRVTLNHLLAWIATRIRDILGLNHWTWAIWAMILRVPNWYPTATTPPNLPHRHLEAIQPRDVWYCWWRENPPFGYIKPCLVGGWFETYASQIGSFPQGSGWKWKIFETTT